MQSLTFECIWNKRAEGDIAQVKALWNQYHAIDPAEVIERRAGQIAFVVKDPAGRIVGVSTAGPLQVRLLNGHFFYEFRCFIAPPFRTPGLDTLLAVKTKDFLQGLEGRDSKFKGVVMVIENQALKNQRTKAVWADSQMVFAGYTREGHHIRVGYFKGARI
ncbi:MAG: hypothetical protein WA874_10665 [Chryseosolibacter sp.]